MHVFTNLAISFDGKVTTRYREHIPPSREDGRLMNLHRARAAAILVGANTLRVFRQPALVRGAKLLAQRKKQGLKAKPVNLVLARHLDFDVNWPFFQADIERVLVVPRGIPRAKRAVYEGVAHIFEYRVGPDFPEQILRYLNKEFSCQNLLIEGGGGILFPWVSRDLIDEWNVTVSPKVIGGEDAPTMVEGEGFDARHIKHYRLKVCQRKGNDVFLQYVRP